jgi:hypothetical protein
MFLYYNIFTNQFFIECPKKGYLKEGTVVENLDQASYETKAACGILPIIDDNAIIPDNHYEDESKRKISVQPEGVYVTRTWIPSPNEIPNEISATGIRFLLSQYNIFTNTMDDVIDSMSDSTLKNLIKIEWEYATTINRNSIILKIINQFFNLTFDQINQGFIQYK